MGRFRNAKKLGLRGVALAIGAALTLGMAVTAPQAAFAAETTAVLDITKTASATVIKPNETMEYRIEVGCSSIADLGCRGATFSDAIPPEFEIIPESVSVSNATANPPTVTGNQITVDFVDPLGDGTVGLLENADAVITVQVRLRKDLPYEANKRPIVNTAKVGADNAVETSDNATVTPEVELKLNTTVKKSYNPDVAQANPGATTELTASAVNTSNAGVDTLILTDPSDPAATPNPFDLLEISSFKELTFPQDAASAVVEYWVGGAWVAATGSPVAAGGLPGNPGSSEARGVRVTFVAADGKKIPTGAEGGFVLNLTQRQGVEDLEMNTTVKNTVESEVALGDASETAGNSADYTMLTEEISVKATKEFEPNLLVEGQETTVTLTGTNTSLTTLDTLTLREPAAPRTFADELKFTGFAGKVQFPDAATGGALTLVYLDENGDEQVFGPVPLSKGGDYPVLPTGIESLQYFTASFDGPITPGGSTKIQFTAEANERAKAGTAHTNVVGLQGTQAGDVAKDEAEDTVTFDEKRLEIVTEKRINPSEIWGAKGEGVLVQLPTTVLKPGSNVNATQLVVTDPELSDPANPNSPPKTSGFWDSFTPQAVTNTAIPDGATLTVRYWDTAAGAWKIVPGFDGLTGTVNKKLPAEILETIGGLQFEFNDPPPGKGFGPRIADDPNMYPSFTATLDEALPAGSAPDVIKNCASASGVAKPGDSQVAQDETDAPACDTVTVKAPTPGEYDLFAKSWEGSGNPPQIVQRSGDHATTRLHWSTENLTFERMTIADTRLGKAVDDGPTDAVAQTTFEAFNLVKVNAITKDKAFKEGWDKISAIDLWIGGEWKPATNATGLPYTKTMGDIALTPAEQLAATAVRIVFEENTAGREGGGADAPPIGSGVTKTRGHDRKIDLEWELRDVRRSEPTVAVIASEVFNVSGEKGIVRNWGSATGLQPSGGIELDQDSDDIIIVPRPLGVTVAKGWAGGPLGVPPGDIPASSYPTSRVTISATNTSPQKVDRLTIVDPGDGKVSPFEVFSLRKVVSVPNNVTGGDKSKTLVVLKKSDGSIIDPAGAGGVTPSQAIALTPNDLADVVRVELRHEGRIATGAVATLQLDLQLRKTHRSQPTKPVTVVDSPVKNETTAIVTDLLGLEQEHSVDADGAAQIRIDTFELGVQTTKGFAPDTQRVEWLPGNPEHTSEQWPSIRMDLTARPTGTARTDTLVVTDSGENRIPDEASAKSFWNAFRFMGFTDDTLAVASPINSVQAEVLYGDFVSGLPANRLNFVPDTTTPSGDGWVAGSADPIPVTGGKVEDAAATLLADISGQDFDKIRGIRFTFSRVDAEGNAVAFENPANPQVKLALDVKRRAYLVSDPSEPVPNSASPVSAPGESPVAPGGLFTNTVDAAAESFVKFPVAGSDELLPLVASAEASARVTYLDGGIEVAVEKTPLGAQQPGSVIPFKLKSTNTAKRSQDQHENEEFGIADPVIIDMLPLVDGKPQLVFDPDMDPDKRFSFELENRIAPATSVIPVNPSAVDIAYLNAKMEPITAGEEPAAIEFRFPDGTVLYPGESYTITVNMMFRPGVLAGSAHALTNSFGISSDQKFAGCNFDTDQAVESCFADTEVYPTEAGALRGKKYVRANDVELGIADVPNPNAGKACVPNFGDEKTGYSVGNCVPVTKPLGIETWREELQNTGTLAMDKVVTIDSLPKPGDQGALVLLPRKSEWQPTWVGNVSLVSDTSPDGIDYRTDVPFELFYSSSEGAACAADLKPTEQQCEGFWEPLTADVDALTVRHVKTVFDFSKKPLAPGGHLAYTFETRTPAQAPVMTADTVAWNSIAVGAETVASDGITRASVLPTEGLRVGVALATGPLAVKKTVTGEGASFAPDSFEVEVLCTVPAREGAAGPVSLAPISMTLQKDETVVLDQQLPYGAECELKDKAGVNGESSSTLLSGTVTIGRDSDPVPVLELENHYDLGAFTVQKQVVGATNQDGEAVDYGEFPVAAECSFLDTPITLDPAEVSLAADGTAWLVTELPIGSKCTLTETDAKGAQASLLPARPGTDLEGEGPWTFTITAEPADTEFVLKNVFPKGAISIEKQVTGPGASAIADDTVFTFAVLCTFQDATVWDGTVELTKSEADAGEKKSVNTLPEGAMCTVAETGAGGATSTVIVPDTAEAAVEVGSVEAPLAFTAVNTYDAGALQVTKEIAGPGASLAADKVFTVALSCTADDGATELLIPGGSERKLSQRDGMTANYEELPVGAECELRETDAGGAAKVTVTPNAGDAGVGVATVAADEIISLTVVNEFPLVPVTPGDEPGLPGTGGALPTGWLFGGVGLLLLGATVVVFQWRLRRAAEV